VGLQVARAKLPILKRLPVRNLLCCVSPAKFEATASTSRHHWATKPVERSFVRFGLPWNERVSTVGALLRGNRCVRPHYKLVIAGLCLSSDSSYARPSAGVQSCFAWFYLQNCPVSVVGLAFGLQSSKLSSLPSLCSLNHTFAAALYSSVLVDSGRCRFFVTNSLIFIGSCSCFYFYCFSQKSVSPLRNSEFHNVGWLLEVWIFVTCDRSVDVVDQGSCPRLWFAVLQPNDLLCRFWVLFFKPSLKGESWEIF
jgi:hypothetical protein